MRYLKGERMNRTPVTLAAFLVLVIAITSIGLMTDLIPGGLIIGGEYNLPPGESSGNLTALFARIAVPDDAIINGCILSFSSDINVGGTITDGIRALESEVKLLESSHVNGQVHQKDIVHWILLLPVVVQIP